MCARVGNVQAPISELSAAISFRSSGADVDWVEPAIDGLRVVANNCPACMLAALRQVEVPENGSGFSDFKFKDESKAWIEDYRASCFGTGYDGDGPQKFDRDEWVERRAKRFQKPEVVAP